MAPRGVQLLGARTPATWRCWSATARPEQKQQWLAPLLEGAIRSCFAMTEPTVASSDATNIRAQRSSATATSTSLNGRKWWTSGAGDPRCKIAIFMGKTDPDAPRHTAAVDDPRPDGRAGRARSMRLLPVFGYDDAPHGHAEVVFEDVRVPGGEYAAGRRTRLRDRAGTAGAGTDPPLHAPDRSGRARARGDVPPRRERRRVRPAAGRAAARCEPTSPSRASRSSRRGS